MFLKITAITSVLLSISSFYMKRRDILARTSSLFHPLPPPPPKKKATRKRMTRRRRKREIAEKRLEEEEEGGGGGEGKRLRGEGGD